MNIGLILLWTGKKAFVFTLNFANGLKLPMPGSGMSKQVLAAFFILRFLTTEKETEESLYEE